MKVNIQRRLLPFILSLVILVTVILGSAVSVSADDSVVLYDSFSFGATGDAGYTVTIPRPDYVNNGNYVYVALSTTDSSVYAVSNGTQSTTVFTSGTFKVLKCRAIFSNDNESMNITFHSTAWTDVFKIYSYPIYRNVPLTSGWQYRKNVTIKPVTDTSDYKNISSFPFVVSDSNQYYVYDLRIKTSSIPACDFVYVPLNISGLPNYDVLPFAVEVYNGFAPVDFELTTEFFGNMESSGGSDYPLGIKIPIKSNSDYYYIRFVVLETEKATMTFGVETPYACISNLPSNDDYIRWMNDNLDDILGEAKKSNNFLQNIWNSIVSGFQSIVNWFSTLISKLTSWFQTVFDKIDNLIDVIKNGTPEQQAAASEVQNNVSSAVGGLNSAGDAMDSVSGAEIDSGSLIPSDLQSDVYLAYTACISKAWDSQVLTSMMGVLMSLILISYVFHGKKEG